MHSFLRKLCCGRSKSSNSVSPEAPSAQYRLSRSVSPASTVVRQPLRGLEVVYDGTKSCQRMLCWHSCDLIGPMMFFFLADPNGTYHTTITIKNPNPRGTNPIIFKIMINVHNVYVRPNRGLLVPGGLLPIQGEPPLFLSYLFHVSFGTYSPT